jgi:Uncharacterized protein conserved in bacteria, putative lipoprotein
LFLGSATIVAQAESFYCEKAHNNFDRIVCGQASFANRGNLEELQRQELMRLDGDMNAVYQKALRKHFDPALLRREQRAWVRARDLCAQDDGCGIFDIYHDRITNLRYDLSHPPATQAERDAAQLLSMGSPPGNNFAFDRQTANKGYGFGLCEALVRWFNNTTPTGNMIGPRRIAHYMPGLSEPEWQELDVQQHKELFAKLIKATRVNAPPKVIHNEIEAGLGGAYRLWMVKEDVYKDAKPETLAMFTVNAGSAAPDGDQHIWGAPQIVTDDLHDIDKQANINVMSAGGVLLNYKGEPYFISADANGGYVHGRHATCSITNFKPKAGNK